MASFCGLPVRATLTELGPVDAVVVTAIADFEAVARAMEAQVGHNRVLLPPLLGAPRAQASGPAMPAD